MRIWKYRLAPGCDTTVRMPIGAHVVRLGIVSEMPCVYALCDPEKGFEDRKFTVKRTGESFTLDRRRYVESYEWSFFTYHVFEEAEEDS